MSSKQEKTMTPEIEAEATFMRWHAKVSGILYLTLGVLGGFGIMYVSMSLLVPGDTIATVRNVRASTAVFRLSILSDLLGQVVFIFLVLSLYQLLKKVNKAHAVLMLSLAFIGIPIAMLNVVNKMAVVVLSSGAKFLSVLEVTQINALIMLFFELSEQGVNIAQIFWGLWLFPLGYLVFKSGFLPRALGILLMIGCVGYVVDSIMMILAPQAKVAIGQFTFIGELLLPLWLLIKGIHMENWQAQQAIHHDV